MSALFLILDSLFSLFSLGIGVLCVGRCGLVPSRCRALILGRGLRRKKNFLKFERIKNCNKDKKKCKNLRNEEGY